MVSALESPPVRSINVNEATIVILEDQVQCAEDYFGFHKSERCQSDFDSSCAA